MTLEREYRIKCDGCGNRTTRTDDAGDARDATRAAGWIRVPRISPRGRRWPGQPGADYCTQTCFTTADQRPADGTRSHLWFSAAAGAPHLKAGQPWNMVCACGETWREGIPPQGACQR